MFTRNKTKEGIETFYASENKGNKLLKKQNEKLI
jgi:hypothetical protein